MRIEIVRLRRGSLLLLAAALFVVGCGLNVGSSGPKVATSIDGQFQVTMPSGWSVQTELNDQADIQVANPQQESYLVVLSESKADFEDPTIEWHSQFTRSALLETVTGGNASEPKELQINGYPAVKSEIRGTTEGIKVIYLHTTVDTGDHLHQVLAWTLPSYYDANIAELESVISSFKATSQ